ncbi:hypothetical protein, partial [Acidiphilium sp. PM]|uniref:hypothetical protein n=1 Tax=Acidiphilium sp. PM TaxID=1043206 RepID=UPI0002144CF3
MRIGFFSTTIIYVINKYEKNKYNIINIVNSIYRIGVPDVIIIDRLGINSELEQGNRYFKYFSKYNNVSPNEILSNREKYLCHDNIVVVIDDNVSYQSGYINRHYLNRFFRGINDGLHVGPILVDIERLSTGLNREGIPIGVDF